jgi:hypothetical protein
MPGYEVLLSQVALRTQQLEILHFVNAAVGKRIDMVDVRRS